MQSNGLSLHISSTTRNTDKSKSLIDLALTNSKFISDSGTLNHFISDHQPIFIVHKKIRDQRHSESFSGRSYRNYDRTVFERKLKDLNWVGYYQLTDPELAWEFLIKGITQVLDAMCPVRAFSSKIIGRTG